MRPQGKTLFRKAEGTGSRISKTTAVLILFCVLLVCITAGVTARYMQKTENNDTAVAKEFYFTSDLLDGNTHEIAPLDTDSKGNVTGSVTITLMNHADALRFSEVDINYSVSVSESSEVTISPQSGKINSGEDHDATVKISGLQPGKTYKVTAKTNNTYSKTLTGTIKVNDIDSKLHASLADKTQYIEVNVWSVDTAHNDVTLTYCAGLIPDNTDSLMASAKTAADSSGQSISSIKLDKNTSHMFRFFRADTSSSYNVSVSGSTVTITNQTSGS